MYSILYSYEYMNYLQYNLVAYEKSIVCRRVQY